MRYLLTMLLIAAPLAAQPTAAEVALVYELNRARSNPQAYDAENGLGGILNGVAAQPPLALNNQLCASARAHSEDMATNGYFAHTSPTLGEPNAMAINAGYPLPYSPTANNIESIACRFSTAGSISYSGPDALESLIIDLGISPPGHRIHLLAMDTFWQTHREVGTGYAEGLAPQMGYNSGAYWTIHTAERTGTDPVWITGVVYDDTNGNRRYDLGEGLAGVSVSAVGATTVNATTNAGGGYSLACATGNWTVTATGGAFAGTSTGNVALAGANVAVDFRSGVSAADIGFNNAFGGGGGGGGDGGEDDSGNGCVGAGGRAVLCLTIAPMLALLRRRKALNHTRTCR